MGNIVILIPFGPSNARNALAADPEGLQAAFIRYGQPQDIGNNINGNVTGVQIVYPNTAYNCNADDYVIILAHGSSQNTNLYVSSYSPVHITRDVAIQELNRIGAANAERVLCMVCFSSSPDHIGAEWKANHGGQTVFASDDAIANLYSTTRSGLIRQVCAALREL